MSAVRLQVASDQGFPRAILPGELILGGESLLAGAISTVGAGVWTGAAIATGIIQRTGPVGGYTDTTDTAANIIAALAGNSPAANIVPGSTFRLLVRNTVAQALTFAAGTGVTVGTGTVNIGSSLVREYLLTILSACPQAQYQMTGNNTYYTLFFGFNVGSAGAAPANPDSKSLQGSNGTGAVNLLGATVTGTNVGASCVVTGLIEGVSGIIGVYISVANTGAVNGAVTFGPTVQIDSIGTMGL